MELIHNENISIPFQFLIPKSYDMGWCNNNKNFVILYYRYVFRLEGFTSSII